MEKQKKVLNVIKGYMSKFDIEELTIIEDDKDSVIFSGDVEKFLHPCETMQNEAYRIKMSEVKRVLNFNDEKLFIFIQAGETEMSNAETLNQYIKELFDYWNGKNDDFESIPIPKEVDDEIQRDSFY